MYTVSYLVHVGDSHINLVQYQWIIYIRSCRSTCVYCLIKINISPGAISSYPAGISDRRVMVFQDIFFFSADFLIILTAKHAADIKWARKCICD